MRNRDNFPKPIVRLLAERASQRCSFPDCGKPTSGPHTLPNKSIIIGVAAHIYAASPGGKRYNPDMSSEQRAAADNGIWLCENHAKLIDTDEQKFTPEILKQWKLQHEAAVSKELVGSGHIEEESLSAVPKVTAKRLVGAGLKPNNVSFLLSQQEQALRNNNIRLIKFLNNFVMQELNNMPIDWRGLIAGFPIIAEDICSNSMNQLAAIAKEIHPYISKGLRKEYHRRAEPVLMGILAEVESFLEDSSRAGGFPLEISSGEIPSWKDWIPWSVDRERIIKIDEALVRGYWSFLVPAEIFELYPDIDIGRTWAGFLYDIICRLPDPDKQKGKFMKKYNMAAMMHIWCSTAAIDFKPSLKEIIRTPVSISDRTLAGIYKRWFQNSENT